MLKRHRVRPTYLLIIEWLGEDERKTGSELYELLKGTRIPMQLAPCKTRTDVLNTLFKATEKLLLEREIPIIQFESHGSHDGIGPSRESKECLTWKELAKPLRHINLLSRFNLIVVGAACYGFSAIGSFDAKDACPYTIGVGFSSKVFEGRLATTMREFHRELLCSGRHDVNIAIDVARNELGSAGTFDAMNCETMAKHLLTAYVKQELNLSSRQKLIDRLQQRLELKGMSLTREEIEEGAFRGARSYLEQAIPQWFAYESIPENRERFVLDADAIFNLIEA